MNRNDREIEEGMGRSEWVIVACYDTFTIYTEF